MLARSRAHLNAAGESYFEHLRFAATVGAMAIGAGLACLIHGMVPALCQRTCSRTIVLLDRLFEERGALREIAGEGSGAITFVGLLALSTAVAVVPLMIGGQTLLGWLTAATAFAIPLAFLMSNPELKSVEIAA